MQHILVSPPPIDLNRDSRMNRGEKWRDQTDQITEETFFEYTRPVVIKKLSKQIHNGRRKSKRRLKSYKCESRGARKQQVE